MRTATGPGPTRLVGLVLLLVALAVATNGQSQGDARLQSFRNPPDTAKPRVWWHWMSGNVTKEGIKADLEWMKRAGIAGFQNFDAGLNTPQIVEQRLVYMTPEWKEAFKYATTLADQLGLEMAIAGSPGWSESGGPWVTPAQAMKKYVWSETRVEGGRPFTGSLPKPPSTTGPYQNQVGGRGGFGGQAANQPRPPTFYADAAVVAYRAPDSDRPMSAMQPKVSHRNARAEAVEATFRVQGKAPELWYADTGTVEPVSYKTADGRTTVSLTLQPNDAVFVVFRKPAAAPSRAIAQPAESKLSTVEGAWDVAFQANRGAPARVTLPALVSWHEHADPGVRYFSGTGTYTKTIQAPADWFQAGARLFLDLGDVKNIADVTVNGKALGIYWKAPILVDVTSALKPGANTLDVTVINLWVNRLIGDQQEGVTTKYTYTAQQFYRADSPLLPSGLIGPVQVIRAVPK